VRPIGGSLFAITDDQVEEVAAPELRQGMIEASNVALADEMVSMMEALRTAESGAKLVQTYDDLMGKAVSAFGSNK
jgi:flagellar basal-body rod protein FlgF